MNEQQVWRIVDATEAMREVAATVARTEERAMSKHTKAGRKASFRWHCAYVEWLRREEIGHRCICDFRGGCGGLGTIECRGCGGDCCVCTCGGEAECDGCDDCNYDDGEMWTEDRYDEDDARW